MRLPLLACFLAAAVLVVGCSDDVKVADSSSARDEPTATPTASDSRAPAASPTAAGTPVARSNTSGPTGTASGPAEHDGARAMAHVSELADEPRVSGTAGETRAAEYIANQFRAFGYTTEVMEFEFDGDRFRAGEVTVDGNAIEALTLAGSPGGKVSAPAAYVGLADQAGIAGRDLSGKVAVADRGTLNFVDKYLNVKDAGAIGLVVVNNRPGPFSGNLTTLAAFPVVGVSQEAGAAVLAAAKAGGSVGINAPPTVGLTKALNVVARASANGECRVLVGGHFDTVPGAPGANDNASGTANVLELARATAADGLDAGLCFAAFGAEESGLYGSKALVERMRKEAALPRYMVNLDVTGIGDNVEVIGNSPIAARAIELAKGAGITAVPSSLPANSGSDHQSFEEAGVPTVFFTSGDFSTIHSPQDVSGAIEQGVLDQVGDAAFTLINALLVEVARG